MRLTEWLRRWRSEGAARRRRASRTRTSSLAELLEPRALLAGSTTASISRNATTGEVLITGTSYSDMATVSAPTATSVKVRVVTGSRAVEATYATTDVAKITFNAGGRSDRLTNTTDRPVNMNGGDGNDTLIGGSGNDTFAGGNGDDSVSGGLGDDAFAGSSGNDYFDGGLGNDFLSMTADTNFVLTDTSLRGPGLNTLANLERVQINGGPSANTIDASLATLALTLNGNGGNDSIIGGLGNDSINGGDGLDSLNGFTGNDTVLGGTGDDFLQGGSGVDFVDGGDGNDHVLGSGGSGDTVRGGLGNDTLDGGDGLADIISESADVSFTLSPTQLIGLGTDSILNIEGVQLVGGASANRFDVSTSLLPTTLTGGLGNDTFLGSTAVDLVVESGDVNFTVTNTQLTGVGIDTLTGIDRVRLNGGLGANLFNASATSMRVTLNGGDGNDTLIGGSAADRLDGGTGNDQLTGNLGADTILGGDGVDRLVESGDMSFGLSNASLIGLQTDTLFTLEEADLSGGASANSLTVSNFPGPVTLRGGGGNDTLEGTPFNDLLDGGAGNDLVSGEEGNDVLLGSDGGDTLNGGSGNDSLAGGLGNDNLYGDTGNDTAMGDAGNDTLQGRLGDDLLDGGADADIVLGQQGHDTVLGGTGRDFVIGGQDRDSVGGGDGDDIVLGGSYEFDLDFIALASVLTNWNGTAAYLDRVTALQNTAYPYFLKSLALITDNATVYDDYAIDTVNGGLGQDFVLRPGEPGQPTMDTTPDFDSTLEVMDVSVFGTEAAGYFPSNMTKPGYLATLNDPTFGTPITRITGDAGTTLTLPVNVGGTASIYWSGAVRTRYVTESSWNIDGSLMMLRSYDPAMPYQIVLNGSTYQPMFMASLPSTNYRWSQNPATPNVQYGFIEQNIPDAKGTAIEGTAAPLPAPGPDDDKIVRYDVTTGQTLGTITLPFNKLFSAKSSIAFANGHEYAAMFGVDKLNPSSTSISVYVVQLDAPAGTNPVVASMLLTTADSGTPEAAYATALDFSNLWFSPNGRHILTIYNGSTTATRSWRLLDVDYASRTITPHVIPDLTADNAFQTNGDRLKGHMPVNWSHPVFALGPNGSDVYIVGVSGQFNGRSFPQSEITTANGVVGSVLAFNVTTNTFKSLTNPTNENLATHITATNTQHPGYVFVSYWNDTARGSKYSGEIIAINLDNPFGANGTIELVHHRTNVANHAYHANTLPTVSPDGTRLVFSSSWGTLQSVVQSFVLDLRGLVP